jgi:heme exporter protein A
MPFFEGRGLACHRGGRDVFEGLGFAMDRGGALLVTGPNGSGKSSLLRILAGLLRPSAGTLILEGSAVAGDLSAYQRRLCYVGHADALKPVLTVRENLAFWNRTGAEEALVRALDSVSPLHLRDTPARLLSQGQKRRLALTRLMVSETSIWLLDEPTVGLDVRSLGSLERIIADHRAGGGLVVLTTHGRLELAGATKLSLDDHAVRYPTEMIW